MYKYIKTSEYLEHTSGNNCLQRCLRVCLVGEEGEKLIQFESANRASTSSNLKYDFLMTSFCFFGLLSTYLTWGYLQEKIMTQEYRNSNGDRQFFKDSQFLVFVNRALAVIFSGVYLLFTKQPRHTPPLYKYIYASLSNIMSSWCQYEALKFVSFPTQVLTKASKIIPVMVMGKLMSQKKYEYYEYVTAISVSIGMMFFLFGTPEDKKSGASVTTVSGCLLLIGYVVFDSFTSNWQGALFSQYRMSSVQMMCGVNVFSSLLLLVSLVVQGSLFKSLAFMTMFPAFVYDCIIISTSSAAGQFFIFFTIENFGPVVFTIFMTVRQVLSVLLSCYSYSHTVSNISIIGVVLIFIATFLRLYCDQQMKTSKRRNHPLLSTPV
ncbi:adenosine 3'-phospho 5'-phosphosulfate transporter 1 isoform X2 [Bemisia tabaci]|nr:PREDICTED: adenosine 3'-phospho 5'-phosphosulfate transporter 1 [Bemisia tabaci]